MGKFILIYVHVLHNTSHWEVSRSSHAGGRQRKFNVLKCAMQVQRAVVLLIKLIVFMTLLSSSSLLKLPNDSSTLLKIF